MTSGQGCLDGVRVLDLSQFESGPSCTEVLAWLGAEVVKIESPRGGDPGRSTGGAAGQDGRWFALLNANKKSLTVDLKSQAGIALVRDMSRRAHVFVENFAPGTVERLGLSYDVLREANSALVYAQIKGFGKGSPYEANLAFDPIGQATGGSMSITGERDGAPARPGPTIADSGSGMLMAVSILGALYRARATGKGSRLELAMQDAVMQYMRTAFAEHARTGKAVGRAGAKSPSVVNVPSNIYPCRPGGPNDYVYVYASRKNIGHWHRLLRAIGSQELIGDPRFESPAARVENEVEVDRIISAWTREHDKHEAARIIGAAGVPVGPVLDSLELESEPTFEQRGIMQTVKHPTLGVFKMLAWPVRHDGSTPVVEPAPLLGQHTASVLGDWLGLDASAVARLHDDGVV